jgi:acetyl-CoA C-acetyltransferase
MTRKVAVIGVGSTTYTSTKRETRERSEIGADCIRSALDFVGNGISMSDIDAVYFASVDAFEGVQRPERSMDCFGQPFNIPVYTTQTGGTAGGSAIKAAHQAITGGIYDIVIAYGSCTTAATVEAQQILNSASPALIEKPLGAGAIHMGAYYLTRYLQEYKINEEDFSLVAAKSHKHAKNNPYAHIRAGYTVEEILASPMICSPIRLYEVCPVSSGATCLILASEEKAKELSKNPVWLKAIGSITDTYLVGYKNYLGFPMLKVLAKKIYEKVGITAPLEQIDYAELFNPFAGFEYLEYEALGFCKEGEAPRLVREGITDLGGKLPVNLSGGTLCTNAGISASVSRHAETCLQIMGKIEGERQVKDVNIGISHAWGGNMGQYHTLAVFSR